MINKDLKRCHRCFLLLPFDVYSVSATSTDGLTSLCCYCESDMGIYITPPYNRGDHEKRLKFISLLAKTACIDVPKHTIQSRTSSAIRSGKIHISSMCADCGTKDSPLYAHHFRGYTWETMFDVQFLCPKCHAAEHKRLREASK